MTAADFRRIALSLEGVEEYSHAGLPAFRVGGRKFASLASQAGGFGNLMLTLEQQAAFGGGSTRDLPAHSWRLGKDGTHAYSPGGGERGCTDGCTSNGFWPLSVLSAAISMAIFTFGIELAGKMTTTCNSLDFDGAGRS